MSVRTQAILVGAGFLLLVLLWFFLGFRPQQDRINELRDQQEETQSEIGNLRAQLERLQELQRMEPQLRAQASRLQDALPTDPRIPDFILQVQDAANLAGIDFLSISPSLPSPFTPPGADQQGGPADLQSISVSIQTTGTFFELEDFIIRLERLPRAVRINTFSLSPGGGAEGDQPGASPTLSVTFAMQIFLETAEPVSPGTGGSPPAGATPAPDATAAAEAVPDETSTPLRRGA